LKTLILVVTISPWFFFVLSWLDNAEKRAMPLTPDLKERKENV